MGVFGTLATKLKRSASVTDDIADGARSSAKSFGQGLTSPLGIAGVSVGGAYGYGQYSDLQENQQQTERYQTFQDRLDEIQRNYERGEITKQEMRSRKEQARQEYYAAQGDTNRGLTPMQVLAEMSPLQLATVVGGGAFISYFLLRPLVESLMEGSPSLEGLLG